MTTKEREKLRNIVGRLQVILEELEALQKTAKDRASKGPPAATFRPLCSLGDCALFRRMFGQ
jgi:hypothetical protein